MYKVLGGSMWYHIKDNLEIEKGGGFKVGISVDRYKEYSVKQMY